jgi:hypothetical protein
MTLFQVSYHVRLVLSRGVIPSISATKMKAFCNFSNTCYIPNPSNIFYMFFWMIICEEYKFWTCTVCSVLQSLSTSALVGPNARIHLAAILPHTHARTHAPTRAHTHTLGILSLMQQSKFHIHANQHARLYFVCFNLYVFGSRRSSLNTEETSNFINTRNVTVGVIATCCWQKTAYQLMYYYNYCQFKVIRYLLRLSVNKRPDLRLQRLKRYSDFRACNTDDHSTTTLNYGVVIFLNIGELKL